MTSKKYDLDLDEFIIRRALYKKNMGYRELFREIGERYHRISFETFNRHINHLKNSGWIDKDAKYSQYHLTEKCKEQLKLGTLFLSSPHEKAIELTSSAKSAMERINVYILLLLFKSDSSYEFTRAEELEYFLSLFGLSKSSLAFKIPHGTLYKSNNEIYTMAVLESRDGRISIHEKKYVSSPRRLKKSISFICNIKGVISVNYLRIGTITKYGYNNKRNYKCSIIAVQ